MDGLRVSTATYATYQCLRKTAYGGMLRPKTKLAGFAMETASTENEFESLSWHDCSIWGIDFLVGDPDEDDWTDDLVFHLDFIVEWICGVDRKAKFRVAPARLAFHGVTGPKIAIDWGDGRYQVVPHAVTINRITREPIKDQKVFPGRPYFRWTVDVHPPIRGVIEFGAVGFTQTLLAEPILCDRQHLTLRKRSRLTCR